MSLFPSEMVLWSFIFRPLFFKFLISNAVFIRIFYRRFETRAFALVWSLYGRSLLLNLYDANVGDLVYCSFAYFIAFFVPGPTSGFIAFPRV